MENNQSNLRTRLKAKIAKLRESILPINKDDSSVKKLGKNVAFVSFIVLMSVVTLVLTIVISAVL